MKTKLSCLFVGLCLLTGCWQKSLLPFYQATDVRFDPKLLGAWKFTTDDPSQRSNSKVWTFTNGVAQEYRLTIAENDQERLYVAHLFELGGMQWLDLFSAKRGISTVPAHNLLRVVVKAGSMELSLLDTDWVQGWLRKNPTALAHIAVEDPDAPDNREKDELVLTAETKALQKFLVSHKNDAGFFESPKTYQFVEVDAKKK